jgi:DNA-binding response OmpR family regulator
MKHKYARPAVLPRGASAPSIKIDLERYEVTINGKPLYLSTVLFDLLRMICEADGRVVSRQDALRKIHGIGRGQANELQTRSIDQSITKLRRKLGKHHVILTVPGRGYKLIRY